MARKTLTMAEKLKHEYDRGVDHGQVFAASQFNREKESLKIEMAKAVTALIKETTANLSKAGYLIAQLNKEKGW